QFSQACRSVGGDGAICHVAGGERGAGGLSGGDGDRVADYGMPAAVESVDHFIFTLNCSDALNLGIKGLVYPGRGGHAICTEIDHNSILRPLNALADAGRLEQTRVPIDPITGLIDPDAIAAAIRSDTRLIAVTHASNVTGTLQPVREIG